MTLTTHPDGRPLSRRAQRMLEGELRTLRATMMFRYRHNLPPVPGVHYVPYKVDAVGLYCIAGPYLYEYGNPLDGFYTVDDFGALVRISLDQVHLAYTH